MMRLARAMRVYTLLEQPTHNATGGMENLSRFRDMVAVNPVPRCSSRSTNGMM